jgi:hypothetical protein
MFRQYLDGTFDAWGRVETASGTKQYRPTIAHRGCAMIAWESAKTYSTRAAARIVACGELRRVSRWICRKDGGQ